MQSKQDLRFDWLSLRTCHLASIKEEFLFHIAHFIFHKYVVCIGCATTKDSILRAEIIHWDKETSFVLTRWALARDNCFCNMLTKLVMKILECFQVSAEAYTLQTKISGWDMKYHCKNCCRRYFAHNGWEKLCFVYFWIIFDWELLHKDI